MNVKECYDAMGADYEEIVERLLTDERIQRFLLKFLNDQSYALLCSSLNERNMEEAFRAAHTLKGVSQNLSLAPLYQSAARLTDMLRERKEYGEDIEPALELVKEDYIRVTECIKKLA